MAGPLLDIWGNYDQAINRYQSQLTNYNKAADLYNNSVIWDTGQYSGGNYQGSGPYTYQDGYRLGRIGTPIKQYQTEPTGYRSVEGSMQIGTDPETGQPIWGGNGLYGDIPTYADSTNTTYINPNTGLASLYQERPPETFTGVEPTAPLGNRPNTTLGNMDPTQLYQSIYGRATPDILSNEAWSLANLSSPFFSTAETTPYETGAVSRVNNPLYAMSPNELTTGQLGQPTDSTMNDQNPYY